jgi:hypothetical protein
MDGLKKTNIMKKIIFGLLIILFAASCKKEDVKPCNCGLITSDNVSNYSVTIRNDCSGNYRTFFLTQGDWMTAYVGSNYCISNVASW